MKPTKLKILQLNTYDKWGGAEKMALQLHRAHLRNGHWPYLAVKKAFLEEKNVWSLTPHNGAKKIIRKQKSVKKRVQKHQRIIEIIAFAVQSNLQRCKAFLQATLFHKSNLRFLKPILRCFPRWEGFQYNFYAILCSPTWRQKWDFTQCLWQGREAFDYPMSQDLLLTLHNDFNWQPHLIHAHNLHGNYFDLRLLEKLSHKYPVFLTLHDQWSFTGHCAHSFDCSHWQSGCGKCPDLNSYPPLWRDGTAKNWKQKQKIYQNSKLYIVTPSQWLMECVQRSMLAPALQEARVIPNGIDLSVFRPGDKQKARQKLGIASDASVVLSAASGLRHSVYKDYKTLSNGLKVASQKIENLVLLAPGAHMNHQGVKRKRLAKATMLFYPFEEDPSMLVTFYHAADVYVHTTRADTFPSVILEALACGLPVIATKVGGIPELITNGKEGILIPLGDVHALVNALIVLLKNKYSCEQKGKRAQQRIQKKYSEGGMVDSYMQFYREVLAN